MDVQNRVLLRAVSSRKQFDRLGLIGRKRESIHLWMVWVINCSPEHSHDAKFLFQLCNIFIKDHTSSSNGVVDITYWSGFSMTSLVEAWLIGSYGISARKLLRHSGAKLTGSGGKVGSMPQISNLRFLNINYRKWRLEVLRSWRISLRTNLQDGSSGLLKVLSKNRFGSIWLQ